MKKWLSLILILLLIPSAWVLWEAGSFYYSVPGHESEKVVVEVRPGANLVHISKALKAQGLIEDARKFRLLGRFTGLGSKLRVGEYELHKAMAPMTLLKVLTTGKSIERPFTVREGLNMYEVAAEFEAQGFGKAKDFLYWATHQELIQTHLQQALPSLEGYLYPETYLLTRFTTAKKLVELMLANFKRVYREVEALPWSESVARRLSRHEMVILASIIEKETGAPEERPLISSVFHNRLKKGMRLQSDPTILYGILDETKVMPKNIRRRDILAPTKYNTYTVKALPIGPIASPGAEALKATRQPDRSKFLYFVSKNDGTHVFSTNLKDHNKAVTFWQKTRKNRKGRSWRDRLKNQKGGRRASN